MLYSSQKTRNRRFRIFIHSPQILDLGLTLYWEQLLIFVYVFFDNDFSIDFWSYFYRKWLPKTVGRHAFLAPFSYLFPKVVFFHTLNRPLVHFWLLLAPFWALLASFWILPGSLLLPFGCFFQYFNSLVSLLPPFYPF